MKKSRLLVLIFCLGISTLITAQAASLLSPGDTIFGYDLDTNGNFPGGESPAQGVDQNSGTKYLNFGRRHSGLIVTPASGSSVARSFTMTTANDAPERDPTQYLLFGTNFLITSTNGGGTNNVSGFADDWTFLGGGSLAPPLARLTTGPSVNLTNTTAWDSYWIVFPDYRDSGTFGELQFADIQFYSGANATGTAILGPGDPTVGTSWDSDFPGGESAANLIDGTSGAKYLNFGKENAGFWVEPSVGPTAVRSFKITTANDATERDPASWRLLGQSADGSWNLIDSGALALTDDREVESDFIPVNNDTSYYAYRMEFDSLKNGGVANSLQIGEIQFFNLVPEPSAFLLTAGACTVLFWRRRRTCP